MAKSKRKKLTDKLDELCMEIIRERDNWTCQKCGKKVEKSNAHTSHVIPKSRGNALRWDLMNLKLLCYHDHINWWHKSPTESGEWFKWIFPARWFYLESRRHLMVKFTISDLKELVEERKRELKELKG